MRLSGGDIDADCGRVTVNGHAVREQRMLHHSDRLILGRSFCFRIVVPKVVETRRASVDLSEQGNYNYVDDLEHALGEVVAEDCDEYAQCRVYVRELEDRVGEARAQVWLQAFAKVMPLVQEANEISRAIRPRDRLRLSIEVVSDIFTYETDAPELVIRVWKGLSGARRWKNVVLRKVIRRQRSSIACTLSTTQGLSLTSLIRNLKGWHSIEPEEQVVCIWEVDNFKERLQDMRELFDTFQELGEVDFSEPGSDPWQDYSSADMQEMLCDEIMRSQELYMHESSRHSDHRRSLTLTAADQDATRSQLMRLISQDLVTEDSSPRGSPRPTGTLSPRSREPRFPSHPLSPKSRAGTSNSGASSARALVCRSPRAGTLAHPAFESPTGSRRAMTGLVRQRSLSDLEQRCEVLERQLAERDQRIAQLEVELELKGRGDPRPASKLRSISDPNFDGEAIVATMYATVRRFEEEVGRW